MLKEIILKNVASYKDKAITINFDKKIALLYGLNGAGKSTISNYLTVPQDNAFNECNMTKDAESTLYVYNQKYVNETFVTQNGLPGIFTLSKNNGDILKDIQTKEEIRDQIVKQVKKVGDQNKALDDDFSQKKQKLLNSAWKIKESYSGGDRVLEFCLKGMMSSKNDLFEHLLSIAKPEKVDFTAEDLKKEANEILGDPKKFDPLKKIELNKLTNEQESLLKKQIVGDKNSSVTALIARLKNEDWVREGLEFVNSASLAEEKGEQCPFCQEFTISKKLIDSINEYFNEEYAKDILNLKIILSKLQDEINSLPVEQYYIEHKKVETQKDELLLRYRELKTVLNENVRKVKEKIKSPGLQVDLDSFENELGKFNGMIEDINVIVETHNKKIDFAGDVSKNIYLKFWSLMRLNYESEIDLYISEKKKVEEQTSLFNVEINKLNAESTNLRNEIIQLQKKTVNIDEAIYNINAYLKDMGITHFELVKHGENSYKIQREGQITNIYQSLSEGEKTIITFLFFVEQCKGRKNPTEILNKKIVVIDDPISSLSHMFVFNVGRLIRSEFFESKAYEQIIVLTHSLFFFHELVKPKRRNEEEGQQELFRVFKTSEGSQIMKMSSSEIQNEYQSYWSVIKEKSTSEVLLANCMRNILEHYFGFVQGHESINNIFQDMRLKENKFQAFLRYMDRGSHSNITNISDYKEINHDQFKDAFRLVFEVNGHSEHYDKMMK